MEAECVRVPSDSRIDLEEPFLFVFVYGFLHSLLNFWIGRSGRRKGLDEEIHEPPKRQGSSDHDQEEREAVADLRFFFVSSDQG